MGLQSILNKWTFTHPFFKEEIEGCRNGVMIGDKNIALFHHMNGVISDAEIAVYKNEVNFLNRGSGVKPIEGCGIAVYKMGGQVFRIGERKIPVPVSGQDLVRIGILGGVKIAGQYNRC
jgi:hypothetical protein